MNEMTHDGWERADHHTGTEHLLARALAVAGIAGAAWLAGMVYVIAAWLMN